MRSTEDALKEYRASVAAGVDPEDLFLGAWSKAQEARRDAIKFRARLRKTEAALAQAAGDIEKLAEVKRDAARDRSAELAEQEIV